MPVLPFMKIIRDTLLKNLRKSVEICGYTTRAMIRIL